MKSRACAMLITVGIVLLALGCRPPAPPPIYVDGSNVSGPWNGTVEQPYRTIQDGLDVARSGDIVLVKGGYYDENVTMGRGVELRPWRAGEIVVINGASGAPTILARGQNRISGFIVEGGTVGVQFDLAMALADHTTEEIHNYVSDCEIRNTGLGILVETPTNLAFGSGVRKSVYMHVSHNYIRHLSGDGMRITLNGPTTGELQISLDIKDNVLQDTFTGITVIAKGQGPNPGGFVRASVAGWIDNNLIFDGTSDGISLYSENLGSATPAIAYNTIAGNMAHGINASAEAGSDGKATTFTDVINNIIVNNLGYGYQEFDRGTSASLIHNLFHNNFAGHYCDVETDSVINSQSDLNTPTVDGKVVFRSAYGNLVSDPLFVDGQFPWMNGFSSEGAHAFFLRQDGTTESPAIDAGDRSATDAELDKRTTRTDYAFDTGVVDIGFHYMTP